MAQSKDLRLNLKAARREINARGLKQGWIAGRMRIHPKTLSGYLSGARIAPPSKVVLLANVLGIEVEKIAA